MSDEFHFKAMVRKALFWALSQGIWVLYRFEPESKDGPQHVLRMGVAVFDDEDFPMPYFFSRGRRHSETDHDSDSGFGGY